MKRFCIFAVLFFCIQATESRAEIVNIHTALVSVPPEGLSGVITGSVDWRSGNINTLIVSAAPALWYKKNKHLWIGLVQYDLGIKNDENFRNRAFQHLRYRYSLNSKVTGELFVQNTFDQFRRIAARTLVGVGPSFRLISRKHFSLNWGIAYMFEHELLSGDGEYADCGAEDFQNRISSYLMGSYTLDDRLQIVQSIFFQPRLTDINDIRLFNQSDLIIKATDKVSINLSFIVGLDTESPMGVKDLDTALKSSISYTF